MLGLKVFPTTTLAACAVLKRHQMICLQCYGVVSKASLGVLKLWFGEEGLRWLFPPVIDLASRAWINAVPLALEGFP